MIHSNILFSKQSSKTYLLDSKDSSEDVIQLVNPLTIDRATKKNTLELLSPNSDPGFALLNPKPISKLEKKIKRVDKDDTTETEISNKLKLKKKVKTKVEFEDDFESIDELRKDTNLLDDKFLATLARPPKPESQKLPTRLTLKRSDSSKNEKKGKSTLNKKISELDKAIETNDIVLSQPITIDELSNLSSVPKSAMIKSLFLRGILVTANKLIDPTIAQKLGDEFGIKITIKTENPLKPDNVTSENDAFSLPRPAIVTVMGHVDHGKTTLLDKIRKTQLAQKEVGGITQKIGAYEVLVPYNNESRKVVFLDTPGHEAFSKMRSRGIAISDIAILVVAADDGIKPQTIEAIEQIQSSKTPLIVAINKIDKDNADIESIKKELTKYNIIPEEWGGDTLMVPISALQSTNIDKLLETVILLSDILNLKARENIPAKGIILESNLDKSKGAIASLIIKEGKLRVGDTITIDDTIARIRGMLNPEGENIKECYPSCPTVIWGLPKVPSVGAQFFSFKDEKDAKLFIEANSIKSKSTPMSQLSLDTLDENTQGKIQINLIIKADSQGSLEAITSNILKQYNQLVQIRILQSSVGEITETDLEFASTSKSDLLAFNTTYATGVKKSTKNANITIKEFDIIYDLFDYIQTLIDNKIGPQYEEEFIGSGIVKTVFPLAKSFVAGTSVIKGKILKSSYIHILRNSEIIYKGTIDSLKKIKEDVQEVSSGSDCGIFISEFGSWKSGDTIEAFKLTEKRGSTL